MKISVIMLTYNREKLVGRMIDCVRAQSFREFEFIIVDNGSTDLSGAIADAYAACDARIHVIHKEQGYIGSGRNAGLDAASGEWVAFVDDDDTCEPDYLAFLYDLAVKNGADISICGAIKSENGNNTLVGVADKPILMNAEQAIIELLWRKRYNNGFPTKLIRKALFNNIQFAETRRYDDIYIMYKILAAADKIASYGLPKYRAVRHIDNHSSATTKHDLITASYLDDYRKAYKTRTDWLCERFPKNSAYWRYFNYSFQISMIDKIVQLNLLECETHLAQMRKELTVHYEEFLHCEYTQYFERQWAEKYLVNEECVV